MIVIRNPPYPFWYRVPVRGAVDSGPAAVLAAVESTVAVSAVARSCGVSLGLGGSL